MCTRSPLAVCLLSLLSLAAAQKISFDGRLPANTALTSLDTNNKFFQAKNVVGQNVTFSKAIQLPNVQPSIFDSNTVPLEVTIKYADMLIASQPLHMVLQKHTY